MGFPVLFYALILITAVPYDTAAVEPVSADTIVIPFRDNVYNHSLNEIDIRIMYQSTLTGIVSEKLSEAETERGKALVSYYLGRYYQAVKTREAMTAYAGDLRRGRYLVLRKYYTEGEDALAAYSDARSAAENYLELVPGAEAHSLLGEILGQILFLGNVGQLFSIGPKARKNVKTSLTLNPDYVKAQIQEASRLAYSPVAYGGNPDEARALYRKILRGGITDREDEFNVYGGFAMAAFMEERDEQALSWFNEALAIYPGNVFVGGMIMFLQDETR